MSDPLDAEDVDRIERMDMDLLRRRVAALRVLPMPRGSAAWRFVKSVGQRRAVDLTPAERHQVAVLCWAWRRRNLPHGLAPKINPSDPLSPEQLALQMQCTPTLALARVEMARL
jgi:hypothetical protein